MKKIFTFLLLFPLIIQGYSQNRQHLRVLFIGNSYTEVNNLPGMIADIAASVGDTLTYDRNTPGGCTFKQHTGNESVVKIALGGWNYVVLQEQSQYPAFPLWQVQAECFPYAKALVDSVRTNNPNGQAVFYMTWGHRNGDPFNCPTYPPICTYEGMDDLLYERYMMMANDNNATISPVGKIWRYIRTYYPVISLYQEDGSHPSKMGTYAAACTFYTILFQRDPTLIKTSFDLNASQALIIRNLVKVVVYDSLEKWNVVINPNNKPILTDSVSDISQTKAVLYGHVNTEISTIKEVGFEYKLISDSVFQRHTTDLTINFIDTISQLISNQQYVYRAYCLTEHDSLLVGMEKHFSTLTISVVIDSITNITKSTCDMQGTYQYDGNETLSVGLEWKKENDTLLYYKDTQVIETLTYSLAIADLSPSTTYEARAYVIYHSDTIFSDAKMFTTVADDSNSILSTSHHKEILLYPNPTTNIINIELDKKEQVQLLLYNINGQLIQSKVINDLKAILDISSLSNGLYYLKLIRINNYPISYKIIKY